jgi:hypothetical protein
MSPRRAPRPGDAGFVLIGVVIFVLALTIIGLSLFSLSSYEAQFLQRSIDREQAFQSAQGGVERAKFLLSVPPYRMDRVAQDLDDPVVSATAVQVQAGVPDSTGPLEWQGADVTLRVTARVNGQERTIDGRFKPRLTRDVYSQLLSTHLGIAVDDFAEAGAPPPGTDRRYTVFLGGPVWQGTMPPDTNSWLPILGSPRPVGIATDPVTLPAVAQYLAGHTGPMSEDPTNRTYGGITYRRYRLYPGTGNVGYFLTPSSMSGDPDFSLCDRTMSQEIMLRVRGCAIWLMPRGIRFDNKVTVVGRSAPGGDCLVIVAGRSGTFSYDPDAAITFFAGIASDIPVILISDGRVYIQHLNNPAGTNSQVPDLSIYARDVVLTGPRWVSGRTMTLEHRTTGFLDNYWVPRLANSGFLPNVTSASGRELALLPGTWRAYP